MNAGSFRMMLGSSYWENLESVDKRILRCRISALPVLGSLLRLLSSSGKGFCILGRILRSGSLGRICCARTSSSGGRRIFGCRSFLKGSGERVWDSI
jgi:hypothetical protein